MVQFDARSFQVDMDRVAKAVVGGIGTVRRKIALDIHTGVTQRSPVDTGRLRASWFMSDGQPSSGVASEAKRTPQSATDESLGHVEKSPSNPFNTTWIVNNLPYATAIEFGHSSVKAPQGMVRVTLAEVEAGLRAVEQRIPR